jgi:hypothetical protein
MAYTIPRASGRTPTNMLARAIMPALVMTSTNNLPGKYDAETTFD